MGLKGSPVNLFEPEQVITKDKLISTLPTFEIPNFKNEIPQKYYSGIGSRKTPTEICLILSQIGKKLQNRLILRSGAAKGADSAFEQYVRSENKIIYKPQEFDQSIENLGFCTQELESILDKGVKLKNMRPFVRLLLLRDMNQVLGDPKNGWKKSEFLICWTPTEDYSLKDAGGSRYAIRCALKHGIRVHNLVNKEILDMVLGWLK